MSQTTVKNIIKEVLPLLWMCLKENYVKCPSTPEEWKNVEDGFNKLDGLPHQIGALDGIFFELKNYINTMVKMVRQKPLKLRLGWKSYK